jgi:hypothetical protein
MKKLFSIVAALAAGIASMSAVNFNVHVNADNVATYHYYDYDTYQSYSGDLNAGDNNLELPEGIYLYVNPADGCVLISGEPANEEADYYYYKGSSYVYVSIDDDCEGETFNVVCSTYAEASDASLTVNVDNGEGVEFRMGGSNRYVTLTDGANTVPFISSLETYASIGTPTYGLSLYSLKVNGESVTPSTYGNTVNLSDGMVIDIEANYPDVSKQVTFNIAEGAEGFITSVKVNDVEIADFENGFEAKVGSTIAITANTTDYKYESITIGGEKLSSFYGSTSFILLDDTEIAVVAHKYGTLNYTVNIDNPANITFYKGYSYNNDVIELTAGDNALTVSENNAIVTIKANSGCYITSISDGTNEYYTSGWSSHSVTITEGMTLTITTGAINRDKKFVAYFDDVTKAYAGSLYICRSDRSYIYDFESGYNTVMFDSSDNEFTVSAYGPDFSYLYVYLNDVEVEHPYTYAYGYVYVSFNDGDVLKAFLTGEPTAKNVTFDLASLGDAEIAVKKDLITTVANPADGFTAFPGTQVDITSDDYISVVVNDEAVEAVDGTYTFTVADDTTVKVSTKETSISSVAVSDKVTNNDVFNMQGIRVANTSNMKALPAGIYIVNGSKVVVK